MAFPILAVVQAITTLTPLFKKNSLSEKEEAKVILKDSVDPSTTALGFAALGGAGTVLAVGGLDELVTSLVMAVMGIILYFVRAK